MKRVRIVSLLLIISVLRVEKCKAKGGSESDAYAAGVRYDAAKYDARAAVDRKARAAEEEQRKRDAEENLAKPVVGKAAGTVIDSGSAILPVQGSEGVPTLVKDSGDAEAGAFVDRTNGEDPIVFSDPIQPQPTKISRMKENIVSSIRKLKFSSFLSRFRKVEQDLGLKPKPRSALRKMYLSVENKVSQLGDKLDEIRVYIRNVFNRPVPVQFYPKTSTIVVGEEGNGTVSLTLEDFVALEQAGTFDGLEGNIKLGKIKSIESASSGPTTKARQQEWINKGLTADQARTLIDLEAKKVLVARTLIEGFRAKGLTPEERSTLNRLYDIVIEKSKAKAQPILEDGTSADLEPQPLENNQEPTDEDYEAWAAANS